MCGLRLLDTKFTEQRKTATGARMVHAHIGVKKNATKSIRATRRLTV
jgi:hypothetical protein